MSTYLAISTETDSVIASGSDLRKLVREVTDAGHLVGYVTNQDGGREAFATLRARYGVSERPRDLSHWHVALHDEDENRFYPLTFWGMVDSAVDELERVAEYEYEGFRIQSDDGEFEEGYAAYLRSDSADIAKRNLENVYRQFHAATDDERAPLWKGQPETFYRDRVLSILRDDVDQVQVWDCRESECIETWEEEEGETWDSDETVTDDEEMMSE